MTPPASPLGAVLGPPLLFAARDDGARVERLRGFESLARRAMDEAHSVDDELRRALLPLIHGFDAAPVDERRQRVRSLLSLLRIEPPKGPSKGPSNATSTANAPKTRTTTVKPATSTTARSSASTGATAANAATSSARSQARLTTSTTEHKFDDRQSIESTATPTRNLAPSSAMARSSWPTPRPTPSEKARSTTPARRPARDWFAQPLTALKGIGPKRAAMLESRDLKDVGALLHLLPRTYEDRRAIKRIGELEPGHSVVVQGRVITSGKSGFRKGARFEALIDDGSGRMKLSFFRFRESDMLQRFEKDQIVTAAGEVERYQGVLQMVHPLVAQGDATDAMRGIWPVYPEVKKLHPAEIARAIRATLALLVRDPPEDLLPSSIRDELDLPDLTETLLAIHDPPADIDDESLSRLVLRRTPFHLRLAFEEIFALQLALAMRRDRDRKDEAPVIPVMSVVEGAEKLLPFELTGAQSRAIREIAVDLAKPEPMARLLQGDVGAGKTAVAALTAFAAAKAGYQTAILAPTEILAEQHAKTLSALFTPLGIRVDLFTGSLKKKARTLKLARLQNRDIHIAVGTHALLTDDVQFARLGVAVIDEQHRFGVAQRMALLAKGPVIDGRHQKPHLLVMTATPIPRSLALTVYGDLSVSVIDELPPGRTPIDTTVISAARLDELYSAMQTTVDKGERAYVVYPLIDESEQLDLANATQGFDELKKRFGDARVDIVHGRLSSEERDDAMARFKSGEISILVSTTVIEVGVDVPEATLMIVRNAERFGLSQLHQLRGRVGRSHRKSRAILVVGDDGAGKDGIKRLSIMERSTDGFRIAEEDLAIRGPGDFLGTRQHGLPSFAFADLTTHAALIEKARAMAHELVVDDPDLAAPEHRALRDLVYERYRDRLLLAGAG